MERRARRLFAVAVGLFVVGAISVAFAQADAPFGIPMGTPKADLDISREIEPDRFLLKKVPNPHRLIKLYTVLADDVNGVCQITGYIPVNSKTVIDRSVATIVRQIDEKYGTHQVYYHTADPEVLQVFFWIPLTEINRITVRIFKGEKLSDQAVIVDFFIKMKKNVY